MKKSAKFSALLTAFAVAFAVFASGCGGGNGGGKPADPTVPSDPVPPDPVEDIEVFTLDVRALDFFEGSDDYTIGIETLLKNGIAIEDPSVQWTSSAPSVVTVTDGVVHVVGSGEAEIVAKETTTGIVSNTVPVTVHEDVAKTVTVRDERLFYSGRNVETDTETTLYNTAASVEFGIIGTTVKATMQALGIHDNAPTNVNYVKMVVEIDGVRHGIVEVTNDAAKEYVLAQDLAPEVMHTVKLVKATSAFHGYVTLSGITTDGVFTERPADKKLKIEVYGDSFTCGYGINALTGQEDTIPNEDGTLAAAYIMASYFDAQVQEQCYSGMSAVLPHTGWGFSATQSMSDLFDSIAPRVNDAKWDFGKFAADIIVIIMGENDNSAAHNANLYTDEDYVTRYAAFVQKLRDKNPTAAIVICDARSRWKGQNRKIVDKVVEETADENLYVLEGIFGTTGKGGGNHPDVAEQKLGANQLYNFLRKNCLAQAA